MRSNLIVVVTRPASLSFSSFHPFSFNLIRYTQLPHSSPDNSLIDTNVYESLARFSNHYIIILLSRVDLASSSSSSTALDVYNLQHFYVYRVIYMNKYVYIYISMYIQLYMYICVCNIRAILLFVHTKEVYFHLEMRKNENNNNNSRKKKIE